MNPNNELRPSQNWRWVIIRNGNLVSRLRRYTLSLHIQDRVWGWDHVTSSTLAKYPETQDIASTLVLFWIIGCSLGKLWRLGSFQKSKSKITFYLSTTVTWISLNLSYSIYIWALPVNSKIKCCLSCFYHILIATESD